jgi:alkanesulfonate monooxygenase SsuD/methylene tetrahydromethanopterin reductase-like flavin-dependent oxidoreductase (luciferase family)
MRMKPADIAFSVCIGAADAPGTDDATLYRRVIEDALLADQLGYAGVWALEHHFSNYYPTPNPLLFLGHIAARWPRLELGTMVLVAPWHQPLRLAEDMAMLSLLTEGELHLGLGRGSAASEYEAFGLELDESRDRFREVIEIVQRALAGQPFTYEGRYHKVPRPIELRPRPKREKIHLYGAISTPPSAGIMARLGLPPLCNAFRPIDMLRDVLTEWDQATLARGGSTAMRKPIQAHLIVADTDDEAARLAREHMPRFFQAQVEHYLTDLERYKTLKSYDFARIHQVRVEHSDPKNLDNFISLQFFGSPETIRRRVQSYIDAGFDKFIVTANTPDIPKSLRHHWLRRFAREVAPDFSKAMRERAAA